MTTETKKQNKLKFRLPSDRLLMIRVLAGLVLILAAAFVPLPALVKTLLFAAASLILGYDLLYGGVMKLIKNRMVGEELLFVLTAAGAFAVGKGADGAAALLIFRFGGLAIECFSLTAAGEMKDRLDERPETVNTVVEGSNVRLPVGKVKPGDIVAAAPGEILAFDGVVTEGESELDLSALTGNPTRRSVRESDKVLSGSVNLTGALRYRAISDFDHATAGRVKALAVGADGGGGYKPGGRLPVASSLYPAAVLAAAVVIGVLVPLVGSQPYPGWIAKALAFLATSAQYTLLFAVPLTYLAGLGAAAKKGILFRNPGAVEMLSKATSVVFDMEGTLTTGGVQIGRVYSDALPRDRLLMLAAYAEAYSDHPIARAVIEASGLKPDTSKISDFHEIAGKGVEAVIGGLNVALGSVELMKEIGVTPESESSGENVVHLSVNGRYAGYIVLEDILRPNAKNAIRGLCQNGIDRVVLFSRGGKDACAEIASQLGIYEFYCENLPEERVRRLQSLHEMQLYGDKLVYVGAAGGTGDGEVADAADADILMGAPEQVLSERADITILSDEPQQLCQAVRRAQKTAKNANVNMAFSLAVKGILLIVILAAAVPIWAAALADFVAALLTEANALRVGGKNTRAPLLVPGSRADAKAPAEELTHEPDNAANAEKVKKLSGVGQKLTRGLLKKKTPDNLPADEKTAETDGNPDNHGNTPETK